MNFRSFVFLVLLVLSTSVSSGKGGVVLPYKTQVEVDGQNKEWQSPLPSYDKTTGINYSIANDKQNLYLILRVANESVQRQIMQNGLEIWINKNGKKKKVTGITFPLPMAAAKDGQKGTGSNMPSGMQEGVQGSSRSEASAPKAPEMDIALRANELSLKGFLIDNGQRPTKGCPIQVALSKDASNCLIYELAVPFNTFYKEQLEPGDNQIAFCIGIVVKAADTASTSPDDGMSGMGGGMGPGGMGGGMGPGGGGGMGPSGMGPGGNMGTTATTSSDKSFWVKAQLSLQ
jgi:hypothetical protein